MAELEKIIPFLLHCETGLRKEHTLLPYPEMFEHARKTGFADDPDDPGGATMCGITLATYRTYRIANKHATTTVTDLKAIPFDDWLAILRYMFWNRHRCHLIVCQPVANAICDWAWTSGRNAITHIQRLLHVKADGIIGDITLAAINGYADQHELFDKIQQLRHRYHDRIVKINPKLRKYLNGWRRRVNKITWEGYSYE